MNGWNGMEINRINNESMACVYEDVTIGWWKNCNEADDVYVTGITRDPDIEWKNINVVDLKLCKDQTSDNTFFMLDVFLQNGLTPKVLHLNNWNDVNFFNESFYNVMKFLNETKFECELKLELVNKPKIKFKDFDVYEDHISKTISKISSFDYAKFKTVDYFYYYDTWSGMSTWIPVKPVGEWKLYNSNQLPIELRNFESNNKF